MALLVADEFPDVDCGRVVRMCLVHDLGEAFTGDIPAFEKRRQDETHEAALLARWVETLPEPLRAEWRSLYAEMKALATPEARLYKALDKLEAVIQHNEADIATWLPLEYDLNIAYGADEVAWNGYLRRLKEAANEISRQKIAAAKEQVPDDAGCAALCTAVCRVSAKVVCFGRPSACTNVLRNHSEPFLWRFLQAAGLPPFGTKRWCQKHPPGETAGNRRSFFFPRFRKAEFVVRYRATVIIDFPHMATRELAVLPILRDEACGARIAGLRGRRLRPARRPMAP